MNTQLKKGVLDLCVLAQLKERDRYGYELTELISKKLDITAGTLYLILKRLKDDAYVETYLVEGGGGPARKYYHLTPKGLECLQSKSHDWHDFVERINELI